LVNKKVLIGSILGVVVIGALIYGSSIFLAPKPSEPELWVDNPTLDSPISPDWFWEYGTEGDNSDLELIASQNQANYRILGEKRTVTLISGTPNSSNSPGWGIYNNSDFMLPDDSEIRSYGCWVYHYLDESTGPGQVHNFPSVHFRTNISMPVDMSDYVITDASLQVVFNASVNINVDSYNDWNQTANTAYIDWDKFLIGDSANFYVQLSDTNYDYPFPVASFETRDVALGQGDRVGFPDIFEINDTELNYVNEADLIAALNTALLTDNQNFTITLGLDIYCEDNKGAGGGDQDLWNYLIFKTCNLTITYEKKIDYFTSLSLNQIGEEISGANIQVTDANLNFKYKINDTWPTTAPLSEMRIYLNGIFYDKQTIRLNSFNSSFQDVKLEGLDVTEFIDLNSEVNLSIQLFLADTFNLDKEIEISIDDIYLYITIIQLGGDWTLIIIGLSAGIIVLAIALGLYFKVFQFPPMVRKIRKLKKKVRKGKKLRPIPLSLREEQINESLQTKIQILSLEIPEVDKEKFGEIEKSNQNNMEESI
jgi:hypothetical protein